MTDPQPCDPQHHSLCDVLADPRLTDYDLLLENVKDLRDGKPTKVWRWLHKQLVVLTIESVVP